MEIKMLQARNGDCIHLRFPYQGQYKNILIDGGTSRTYEFKNAKSKWQAGDLQQLIETIRARKEKLDLLILTHVDDDHIAGILHWLGKDAEAHQLIGKVWFNSSRLIAAFFNDSEIEENLLDMDDSGQERSDTSIAQGVKFENYIETHGLWYRTLIQSGDVIQEWDLTFTILSPNRKKLELLRKKWEKETVSADTSAGTTDYHKSLSQLIEEDCFKEDTAEHNGSSIAFIMHYKGQDFLFLSDAHPSVVIETLKAKSYSKEQPLRATLVKVAHHGSKSNMNNELLEMIHADSFIISTNGDRHNHPDKQLLARLAHHFPSATVFFNYPELIEPIFSDQDRLDFPYFQIQSCANKYFTY